MTTLGNSNVKNQDHANSTWFFLITPGNSASFLIDSYNFHVLQYSWKFHEPNPLFGFFWNSPIFNSSPMQHLRWCSLWQKINNGWKLLLIVVTYCFVLNVTELIWLWNASMNLDEGNKVLSTIYMFKVNKKTLELSLKYIQSEQ